MHLQIENLHKSIASPLQVQIFLQIGDLHLQEDLYDLRSTADRLGFDRCISMICTCKQLKRRSLKINTQILAMGRLADDRRSTAEASGNYKALQGMIFLPTKRALLTRANLFSTINRSTYVLLFIFWFRVEKDFA